MNGNLLIDKLNELEKRSYDIGNDVSHNIANKHFNDIRFRAFFNFAPILGLTNSGVFGQQQNATNARLA